MHPALQATMSAVDPEIAELIAAEERRQRDSIRLIASENYVSGAVLAATGSVLTNKYSEGYPGKRYYEGQKYIDQVEQLCIDRAKSLFGAEHANVQPYSGSPAFMAKTPNNAMAVSHSTAWMFCSKLARVWIWFSRNSRRLRTTTPPRVQAAASPASMARS